MPRTSTCFRRLCLATAMLASPLACAVEEPSPTRRWVPYVIVSGEADDAEGSQTMLELGSSIGSGWIRGGIGRARLAETEDDIQTDVFTLGGGASIAVVDLAAGFTHRADGDGFKQQDWTFALTWQGSRGALGADVFVRTAESETVISAQRRRSNPRAARIVESIDGTGFGLHGDFDITPALNVFASGMKYDYDIETNRPILAQFSLLNGSAITRSEAFLDRSFAGGATYSFRHATLTAQYMHDEALVEDDVTDSLQLSVVFLLGDHWSLTPMIGVSDNEVLGDTAYGGLSAGYTW